MNESPKCNGTESRNPWRELWYSLLDDLGILSDGDPDVLNIAGLTAAQCDEYTSAVLELMHKENR